MPHHYKLLHYKLLQTAAHLEEVGVGACGHAGAVAADAAVELVEDAVVLIQVAQLHPPRNSLCHIFFHNYSQQISQLHLFISNTTQ